MAKITDIKARMILDSRGNPTVECDITTPRGMSRAAVPSGASTGKFEAHELRDSGERWGGKGVDKAVANINGIIKKKLIGMDSSDQQAIDDTLLQLDGTDTKSKLGANAMLAVSLANARAPTDVLYEHLSTLTTRKKTLPIPFSNVINGGRHAAGKLQIQEFMLVPWKFKTFKEALAAVVETYHELKIIIERTCPPGSANVGDEGGCAPMLNTAEEALNIIELAIKQAGYTNKMKCALDAAASEFYNAKANGYNLQKTISAGELEDYYLKLIKSYPIVSIEDPFDEQDFASFASLTKKSKIQIVGDDLLVTNPSRIQKALELNACNALLLKVNQIGTLSEAIQAAELSFKNKWKVMVSHRSGETSDTFIADLAVALGSGQIKTGAPARSERTEKYNQLLRIEEQGIKYQSTF